MVDTHSPHPSHTHTPASLAQSVHKAAHDIGARIHDALYWQAEVRDALSGTVRKVPLDDLEHLMTEGTRIPVQLAELATLTAVVKAARKWVRAARDAVSKDLVAIDTLVFVTPPPPPFFVLCRVVVAVDDMT